MNQKDIENFIVELRKLDNIEFDATTILDALFLADSIDTKSKAEPINEDLSQEKETEIPPSNNDNDKKEFLDKHKKIHSSQKSKNIPLGALKEESKSETIRIPNKKDFFINDNIIKALSPLKRSYCSFDNSENIDEDATINYVARTNIFQPYFHPKEDERYELYIIIDLSSSMKIWHESIDVFVKKLKIFNYFKYINIRYLDSDSSSFSLYKNKEKTSISSNYINNQEKHSLLFVISDLIASSWKGLTYWKELYKYNKRMPIIIINMLPPRMWSGTILGSTNITNIQTYRRYPVNHTITSESDDLLTSFDDTYLSKNLIKLPVVNFNVDNFESISDFILGKNNNSISGIVVSFEELSYAEETKESFDSLSSKERVENYFQNSSPDAHSLALYFSVSTHLNFPIMKMIQHNMCPKTTQVHLAEFFVGGLLDKQHKGDYYQFYVDEAGKSIRDILLDELGEYKAMSTWQMNSDFIAENLGSSLDFSALLYTDCNNENWNDADKIFAYITSTILDKVGGYYAKVADKIRRETVIETETHEDISIIIPNSKRFKMGSNERKEENPIHEVILNYDFEISPYPVTVGEFKVFISDTQYITESEKKGSNIWNGKKDNFIKDGSWKNPYLNQNDRHPVVCISWNDTQEYIKWLNKKFNENYRLPTEAEWEFSCSADAEGKWAFGDNQKKLEQFAWYKQNSNKGTNAVGMLKSNNWNLYDMHGNIYEWCEDDFSENYQNTPLTGEVNLNESKSTKILRGGSWNYNSGLCRSAFRGRSKPSLSFNYVGFRLAKTINNRMFISGKKGSGKTKYLSYYLNKRLQK